MKITISGSLAFAQEILTLQKQLQDLWHTVLVPLETDTFTEGRSNDRHHEPEFAREGMHQHYNNVASSDAIVVANFDKNDIKWYIGGATLVEMGIACYLGKKIFILHPIPSAQELRYIQEVELMQPIIINNDLSLIK